MSGYPEPSHCQLQVKDQVFLLFLAVGHKLSLTPSLIDRQFETTCHLHTPLLVTRQLETTCHLIILMVPISWRQRVTYSSSCYPSVGDNVSLTHPLVTRQLETTCHLLIFMLPVGWRERVTYSSSCYPSVGDQVRVPS